MSIDPADLKVPDALPLLPVRGVVVFPFMIVPLYVSRASSLAAIEEAIEREKLVFLVARKDGGDALPRRDELHDVGTVGTVMRLRRLPDGRTKVLVQGLVKARLDEAFEKETWLEARVTPVDESAHVALPEEVEALGREVREGLEHLARAGRSISPDVMLVLSQISDPSRLADLSAANIGLDVEQAQRILSIASPVERLRAVARHLALETRGSDVQREIASQAQEQMSRTQREYFLREQLRQIQQELGGVDGKADELRELDERLARASLPAPALEEARKQLRRLALMSPESAESAVLRTYVEWLTELPWNTLTDDSLDLAQARRVLDEDHYDLKTVKERILDHLGVRKLKPDVRGPILCFAGPPGVGKTSLGRSIARALGRRFSRVSLGGVRDEAEIRGHRRTYVGAMPGRIIQALKQAGSRNPVIMLDEIDKIATGSELAGDPYAALLEVLDPEQNAQFRDHYVNLDFDLSQVLFITTANFLDHVPAPLRDRMEVISLSGYAEEEKLQIARRYTLPRQLDAHGLMSSDLRFTDRALVRLIAGYTREAGLRNLERQIAAVCRKVARKMAEGARVPERIGARDIERFLGPPPVRPETEMETDAIGEATGLAWTPAGGEILRIEACAMSGQGGLILTGQLGDVMKESAQAALTWTRAHASEIGLSEDWFKRHEVHVHVPQGAIPKDGPSAGVTMATVLVSLVTGRAVRRDVAMTGEVTLRGRVLAVGGIREKVLAAARAGLRRVLLPKGNERDFLELPSQAKRKLDVVFVSHLDEVLAWALVARAESVPARAGG